MTLLDLLITRIRQDGPMTIATYMAECLLHPTLGYYSTRDPLGAQGDFVTAPEISQMFGEVIGLSLAQCWLDQGRPNRFALTELGPGRGTLMADILRATQGVPGFLDAAQIVLVEASPALQRLQAKALEDYEPLWIDSVGQAPDLPLFLVANEFFDALPIRQFQRQGDGWREKLIGIEGQKLAFGLGARTAQPALVPRLADTRDGDLVEQCAAGILTVTEIARHLSQHGGAALIIDYGDWHSLGDTFQALERHQPVNPLESPGQADLTAHVDFEPLALSAHAAGCEHSRLTPQGVFLERLGITRRAQVLAASLSGDPLTALIQAHRRLTHPEEMGNLFKVLGLYPRNAAPPPGLEP
ncbi:MAG: class I SAM-dependent methyltransferase [Ruegeria sp.]